MNIVPLTSESIEKLRLERSRFVKDMIQNQKGVLLVLGGAFAGENRQHHALSYAITSIFFELYERYTIDFWTYTFDAEGLIYYIRIDEDPKAIKNTMIHYEDYHPLGFAISSDVYTSEKRWTREMLKASSRQDFYYKKPVDELLNDCHTDKKYKNTFIDKIEEQIIKTDKQSVLSNILVYGFVSAYTKPYGFGMYGPNQRGTNKNMNFKNFILLLRTYKNEMKKVFHVNVNNVRDINRFQEEIEKKIQLSLLTQENFYYSVHMSSLVLFAFIKSAGFSDITRQIKTYGDEFDKIYQKRENPKRYDITKTGFKPLFSHFIAHFNEHDSATSTMLYILSRYDDQSILNTSGKQNLLKMQFLSKNLVLKNEKWEELEKFAVSLGVYPHDSSILLANTIMLDIIQRNYIKIKMLFG